MVTSDWGSNGRERASLMHDWWRHSASKSRSSNHFDWSNAVCFGVVRNLGVFLLQRRVDVGAMT